MMSCEQIEALSYVEFISFIRETNRCTGGKDTIRRIVQNTFVQPTSQVLEVGSNTGFTSFEIARIAKCSIVGEDVARSAVHEAMRAMREDHPTIQQRVRFCVASAYNLPFADEEFDLVVTGGAVSFMDDKARALHECWRVLKPWGFLSSTTLFYCDPAPQKLLDEVSDTIGTRIEPWDRAHWENVLRQSDLFESYFVEEHRLAPQSDDRLSAYVDHFMSKDHLTALPDAVRHAVRERWSKTLRVFNENHRYLGYLLFILRKRHVLEEPELFQRS